MGKQNFLQGGFKGKVGAFVGKGWKDMLVIQAAPTVNNPRTEKQQKMRAGFARRVEACKLAMQANYNANFWESTSNTKWALMMSSSSQMYSDTKNILQYTPLIPYGYSPAYVTSADPETSGQNVILAFDTTDDISGRAMSVLLYVKETATNTYTAQLVTASVAGSAGSWTVTARVPNGYEIGDESYIAAVSRDDSSYDDVCLYQPPFSIGRVLPTVTFTLTASNTVSWTSGASSVTFSFTPSETVEDASNITAAETNSGVLQGAFTSESGSATISVIDGTVYATVPVTLDSLGQRPLFVSGSSVQVGAFSFEGEEAKYMFEGGTFAIAETPTTQRFAIASRQFQYLGDRFRVELFDSTGWTVGSVSGEIDVSTVLDDDTIDYFHSNVEVTEYNGATYLSNTTAGVVNWGIAQSCGNSITATLSKNGVQYQMNTYSDWTLAPTNTKYSLDVTLTVNDAFIETGGPYFGWQFTMSQAWQSQDITTHGANTIQWSLTTESGTTSGTTAMAILYSEFMNTEDITPIPSYTNAPTYSITVPQGYEMYYTVPNSGGFTRGVRIPNAQTFTGTMNVY